VASGTEIIRAIITAVDNFSRPAARIALSAGALVQPFQKVGAAVSGVATQVGSLLGPVAALGGAFSAAGIGKALTSFSTYGSNINDTVEKLGGSVEMLQQLRYAGGLAGVSAESLDGGLAKLNKTLGDVATNSAPEAKEVFRQLGISIHGQNGRIRAASELMPEIIQGFERIRDPAVRARVAMALFGRGGQEMIPLLKMGGAEFAKLSAEAARFGLILDRDAVSKADDFGDLLEKVTRFMHGLAVTIGSKVAPVLEPIIQRFLDWGAANRELIATRITDMVSRFADAVEAIDWNGFFEGVSRVADTLAFFADLLGPTGTLLAGLGLVFAPLLASVLQLGWALGGAGLALAKWGIAMTIGPAIGAFFAALKAGTGIVFAFNWALAANPIGLVIAGIVALGAAGYLLYQNWDTVVKGIGQAWDWLREKIAGVVSFMLKSFGAAADLLPDWMGGGKMNARIEQVTRSVQDWGSGGRTGGALTPEAAAAATGGGQVRGQIDVNFQNAPPGMRVQRAEGGGGIDMQADVGYAPIYLGM